MKLQILIATLLISTLTGVLISKKQYFIGNQGESNIPDDSTLSNILDVQTKHFHLEIEIDFESKSIFGNQTLSMVAQKSGVKQINLDVSNLQIYKVVDQEGNILNFNYFNPIPNIFGEQLQIFLKNPTIEGRVYNYTITYKSENASASSWLTPKQTSSQVLPYLYTQCQSVYCRSLAPFQDTPFIKATYTANVTVVDPIVVYLSANVTQSTQVQKDNQNYTIYSFRSDIPIASYVFTIVAGNVVERKIGRRTSVISEPTNIDFYAQELSDLELYLDTVENYTIPYIWGSYKIVIQPPSFPMGGMENPLLTFASPSIIVGDKSGVSVAVHEIAHSWTGNQVTCKNWRNLWINEGFTMYLERQSDSIMFGKDYAVVDAIVGNDTMVDDMNNFGMQSNYTSLNPMIQGSNPDDAFSNIPYEKGYQFLKYIESVIGQDLLQQFLRSYISEYSLKSIDYEELQAFFNKFIKINRQRDAKKLLSQIDWDTWINQPGMPPVNLKFQTDTIPLIKSLAQSYIDLQGKGSPANYKEFLDFSLNEKCIFLQYLFDHTSEYDSQVLIKIDQDYNLTNSSNQEISWRWFRTTIMVGYNSVQDKIEQFLGLTGRIKMIKPVYQAFVQTGQKQIAQNYLVQYQDFYHPLAVQAINRVINGN
ncbi:peptidase M1 family aminopeptidase (macronuclear) [Tetrahymena thermophila SB210]|uniref:Peptidase M1 family aminopeptidase n=1 Tax=Tetrahymena thermophila (strain SB210) TaxID=312017 RepID=Q22HJ7_TETTS|nr:peptidase M1 family aminopeptidase [Tetrahymena thermophila SB210]EAR84704.2 peptidase M1 family aminopeptidase [Tetrahymena thermophila SB210]|eukprot:XP_001032367.2 peptidase M1 family aminopeptidase [Tetrahymena thermophila SB210]